MNVLFWTVSMVLVVEKITNDVGTVMVLYLDNLSCVAHSFPKDPNLVSYTHCHSLRPLRETRDLR